MRMPRLHRTVIVALRRSGVANWAPSRPMIPSAHVSKKKAPSREVLLGGLPLGGKGSQLRTNKQPALKAPRKGTYCILCMQYLHEAKLRGQ